MNGARALVLDPSPLFLLFCSVPGVLRDDLMTTTRASAATYAVATTTELRMLPIEMLRA